MTGWFESGGGPVTVYLAMMVALVVMAVMPRTIRIRLRTAFVLGLLFAVGKLLSGWFRPEVAEDLKAVLVPLGALVVTRVAFVVLLDVVVERVGHRPINQLVRDLVQVSAYVIVVVVASRVAGIRLSSLIATGTVVTAIVALALQETLGNLAAGVALQMDRPLAVGDWLRLDKGDVLGKVIEANWRAVTIQTDDLSQFVIPNGIFTRNPFVNYSRPGSSFRRSLYVCIPYDVPPVRAHEILLAACADCPRIVTEPAPNVLTWAFVEHGVQYWLRYYISDFTLRDRVQGELATRVWYQLHRLKVPFANPMMHNYLHQRDEHARALAEAEVLQDRRAAIEGVDFLRLLSEPGKNTLVHQGHRKLYAPGETILRKGDKGRAFFVIRRGKVAVSSDGEELTSLGPGQFFGELALLTGQARYADVTAITETEVFEIDELMFRDVLRGDPKVAEEISKIVGERQASLEAKRAGADRPTLNDVHGWRQAVFSRIRELFALD